MNMMIKNACQAMNDEGFAGFYDSLASQYALHGTTTYGEFVQRTDRATLPLSCQEDAVFYSVAYAMGHYVTFAQVLADNLVLEDADTVMNIVDYGCGQGIATLATMAHIASQRDAGATHLNIHLVEPSEVALSIAQYKVACMADALGFSVCITSQNVSLAQVVVPDFANDADTLHLMSYILDVPAVQAQLGNLTGQIRQLTGVQWVIASGINTPAGCVGFNVLSHQLTGCTYDIPKYHVAHRRYDVIHGCYRTHTSRAIGMAWYSNEATATKAA